MGGSSLKHSLSTLDFQEERNFNLPPEGYVTIGIDIEDGLVKTMDHLGRLYSIGTLVAAIPAQRLVLKEAFVGDGSTTQFQLNGNILNGSYSVGVWNSGNISTFIKSEIVGFNLKAIYNSSNFLNRIRCSVLNVNSAGIVTTNTPPRPGEAFYIFYFYLMPPSDSISGYYREDFIASMEVDASTDLPDFQIQVSQNADVKDSFKKSVDTTDNISEGAKKFVTSIEKQALDAANSPSNINPFATINDLGISAKFYQLDFTGSVSITILGTQHNFGRTPNIEIYNSLGQIILTNTSINFSTFDVTINFNRTTSGKIILT